ncbi:type III pantothenate kinase, partial [Acidiphilium sp.]
MKLVIDAGNTNIVFAVHDGARWRGTWRIATDA